MKYDSKVYDAWEREIAAMHEQALNVAETAKLLFEPNAGAFMRSRMDALQLALVQYERLSASVDVAARALDAQIADEKASREADIERRWAAAAAQ